MLYSEKRISPGEYQVSVLAMNNHSQSPAVPLVDNGGRYTIGSLTAPDTIRVEVQVDPAKHLVANISWLCDLSSPEGGFNVKVTKPNQESADGYPRYQHIAAQQQYNYDFTLFHYFPLSSQVHIAKDLLQ